MRITFLFEIKRIFNLKNGLVFLLFACLALYFVYFGTGQYKGFFKKTNAFLEYENLKTARYINYEQYGSFGFRVLLQPSSLIIFHHSSLLPLESNIDIKNIVNIVSDHKGQRLFSNNGTAGDFSILFFVLGSLLMLHFGLNTFVSSDFIRFAGTNRHILHTLCCRLVILETYFFLVILASFFLANALGVHIAGADAARFVKYALYVMLFITFFYFLGIQMSVTLRFKKAFFVIAYLVWFIIIFVIPVIYNMDLEKRAGNLRSNEAYNIEKLNNVEDFERRGERYFKGLEEKKVREIRFAARQFVEEYIHKILPLNKAIEKKLDSEVKSLIDHHEKKSVAFPPIFYCFAAKELTGMGYRGCRDFVTYVLELKDEFFAYYFAKRYRQTDQTVEPFVKNNENIFQARSHLPASYWKGTGIVLIYSLLLLGSGLFSLLRLLKRPGNMPPIPLDIRQLEMGKTYFYHSWDLGEKTGFIAYLASRGAIIVEQPDPALHDSSVSLNTWFQFELNRRQSDTQFDRQLAEEILETLGVTRKQLNQTFKNLDKDIFFSVFLALKLAQNADIYVFDDFLDSVSREFEQAFKDALDRLKPHVIIIYFGGQLFDITVKNDRRLSLEDRRFVAVDLGAISLR